MKISRKIKRNNFLWILLILIAAILIFITGCPGNSGGDEDEDGTSRETGITDDHPGDNSDLNNSSQPGVDDSMEDVVEVGRDGSNSESEDDEAVEDDDNTSGGGPVTGFQPTENEPLAPPAEDALGVDDAQDGELSLKVSLSGTGDQTGLQDDITVPVDDRLDVQCSIVNMTGEPVEFSFITGQKLDILVSDSRGVPVYQWSENRRFAQILSTILLEHGEIWSHELTIPIGDDGLAPGVYLFQVKVTGLPELNAIADKVEITR